MPSALTSRTPTQSAERSSRLARRLHPPRVSGEGRSAKRSGVGANASCERNRISLVSLAFASCVVLAPGLAVAQGVTAPRPATPPAAGSGQPRYFLQMQAELQAMGLSPQCAATNATAGSCTVRATTPEPVPAGAAGALPAARQRRTFVVSLRYDDASDTIYAHVEHYALLRADAANALQAFRRLMELNWEMLVGKFEWSPASNEVRLSATMNTDSNFDRRAFRSVVRALVRLADRYADEVSRLTGGPVGQSADTAPATRAP